MCWQENFLKQKWKQIYAVNDNLSKIAVYETEKKLVVHYLSMLSIQQLLDFTQLPQI